MASPFDGMGSALAGVHGAPVIHRPAGGGAVTRTWIVQVIPDDLSLRGERAVAGEMVELRVPRDQLAGLASGDEIETEDGDRYTVGPRIATQNPGRDALIAFELRRAE